MNPMLGNPEMMRQAQEMMSKMSPEDIQRMQDMYKNMDPAQLQAMQAQMMSNPAMMQHAQQQMASMSPEQLRQEMEKVPVAMRGGAPSAPAKKSPTEVLKAAGAPASVIGAVEDAEKLKENGNKRFKAADYDGAIAKYEAAVAALDESGYDVQLTGGSKEAVRELAGACLLNSASSHQKKGAHAKAVACCDTVLSWTDANRKALYRRGLSRLALGELRPALQDLKQAHKLDKSDATVAATLRECKDKVKAAGAEAEGIADDSEDDEVEVVPRPGGSGSSAGAAGGLDPQQAAALQNMNPEQLKAQMEMVSKMDPEMLRKMNPAFKDMPPDMIKASIEAAKNMTPEQMMNMQKMAASGKLPGMPGGGGAGMMPPGMMPGGMPGGGGGGGGAPPDMSNMSAMMDQMSPEMLSSATEMMRGMSPEAMANVMSSMGRKVTPEEAAKMQEQLSKVSPETMQKLVGGAAKAWKMFRWFKEGAKALVLEPRSVAVAVAKGGGVEQLTAALTALLGLLVLGHVTGLF